MSNQLNYKGYSGSCLFSMEDECLHGRILFITDLITYEGNTIPELKESFKKAVNDYLDYCKETGKEANKPYSGTFNVRISPELHKEAAQCAKRAGINLNEYVKRSLEKKVRINKATPFDLSIRKKAACYVITAVEADSYSTNPFPHVSLAKSSRSEATITIIEKPSNVTH